MIFKSFKFLRSNFSTFLLSGFCLVMFFSADAKGWTIQQLMSIGFFQPTLNKLPQTVDNVSTDIAFKNGNGTIVRLSELKGKVVFINFWATWCPPCRAEMPSINKLSQELKNNKDIVFLMVDVDNDYAKAQKFMAKKNFSLPVYTPASAVPETLLDGSIPTTVIFDKAGRLALRTTGAEDFSGKKVIDYMTKLSKN